MTTVRTPITPARNMHITQRAVVLYRHLLTLYDGQDEWEDEGGTRREYLDTHRELHVLLGRKPWHVCLCDTIGEDTPPDWMTRPDQREDWYVALELRKALDEHLGF